MTWRQHRRSSLDSTTPASRRTCQSTAPPYIGAHSICCRLLQQPASAQTDQPQTYLPTADRRSWSSTPSPRLQSVVTTNACEDLTVTWARQRGASSTASRPACGRASPLYSTSQACRQAFATSPRYPRSESAQAYWQRGPD